MGCNSDMRLLFRGSQARQTTAASQAPALYLTIIIMILRSFQRVNQSARRSALQTLLRRETAERTSVLKQWDEFLASFPESSSPAGPHVGLVAGPMRLFAEDGNLHKRPSVNCLIAPVTALDSPTSGSAHIGLPRSSTKSPEPSFKTKTSLFNRRIS